MLQNYHLNNGLKVVSYQIPQMRSCFVNIACKAGSIFDTSKTCGAAHFIEHLLVQATPSYPNVEALSDFIEGLAGSYNAFTYTQSISFQASLPAKHLKDILKLSSEVFYQPLFLEADIERERGAVLEEIRQKQDEIWYKNRQFWAQIRFKKGHPLLLPGGGLLETVSKLQKQDLLDYWARFFHPSNSYLAVVGGFSTKDLKKGLNTYFESNNSKKGFEGFPKLTNANLTNFAVAIREDPGLQSCYLDLTFPSISEKGELAERITQFIIAYILGGLSSSRLYRLLRQRKGLVYSVGFSNSSYSSFGFCSAYSQIAPGKLEEVLNLIIAELRNFIIQGPTETEVEFARSYYQNRVLMQFDHPTAIAGWIQSDSMWEKKIYSPEEIAKMARNVTKKKIEQFMKKYWEFDKLNLVLQGPLVNSKANVEHFSNIVSQLK